MSRQQTLAMATGFDKHAKVTRRAEFLGQMELVVPWRELFASTSTARMTYRFKRRRKTNG